ncbi:MAG: hypothetical protein LBQ18_02325 [Campylobacteraceae bacterium]|nr:hypothetical protein [Campylobacteraceae bacterium]
MRAIFTVLFLARNLSATSKSPKKTALKYYKESCETFDATIGCKNYRDLSRQKGD